VYRQGIQHCSQSPELKFNFALFLLKVGGKNDEIESLLKEAMEIDSKDADYPGALANFQTNVQGNHDEAERLYRKALELDPKHANHTGNYAEFLLLRGRHEEAAAKLEEAKGLSNKQKGQATAEIALLEAILARVTKKDDTIALEELRNFLSDGFTRGSFDFTNVLSYAQEHVSAEDHTLYCAFAEAILDEKKVAAALALLDQRSATAAAATTAKPKRKKTTAKKSASKKTAAKKTTAKKTAGKGSKQRPPANKPRRKTPKKKGK
jgi:tetratricopeptide (TPR) repeat protein